MKLKAYFFGLLLLVAVTCQGDIAEIEGQLLDLSVRLEEIQPSTADYLMDLAHYQDLLVRVLRESKDPAEYVENMQRLSPVIDRYVRYSVHAYSLLFPNVLPQMDSDQHYLNTFKTERKLTAEERAAYYDMEVGTYLQDKQSEPFAFDAEVLVPETLYNFVLFPDGRVLMAYEKPHGQPYQVREDAGRERAFAYPNHTVLSEAPDQGVVTAGALVTYECKGSRLYFLSNKSGHFLPSVVSLVAMRHYMEEQGIDPATVVLVTDLSFARLAFPQITAPMNLAISQAEAEQMADIAFEEWHTDEEVLAFDDFLRQVVKEKPVGPKSVDYLHNHRRSALVARSVFRMLDQAHATPMLLSEYAERIGKMKDRLEAMDYAGAAKQARKLRNLHAVVDPVLLRKQFAAASKESTSEAVALLIQDIRNSVGDRALPPHGYHQIKKDVRDLAHLFWLKAEIGRDFHLNREIARRLQNINHEMGEIRDTKSPEELCVTNGLRRRIEKLLDRLAPQDASGD